MDLVAILIGIAVAMIAGIFIVRPLTAHRPEGIREMDRKRSSLQAQQDRILASIEELDMDHAVGKIHDEDYEEERARLMRQGTENLKALDEFLERSLANDEREDGECSPEDELEASVAKLRQTTLRRRQDYCALCGAKVLVGDRFCVACGAKLSDERMGR